MRKTLLAAVAAPSLLMALAFSPAASAQQNRGPSYQGDAEGQAAYQRDQPRRQYENAVREWENHAYYGVPQWQRGVPEWQRGVPAWQRRGLEAAPRGYRWQRYGDRYALIRRSDGAVVQWRR